MYEMAMMLIDDGGGRRRKDMEVWLHH